MLDKILFPADAPLYQRLITNPLLNLQVFQEIGSHHTTWTLFLVMAGHTEEEKFLLVKCGWKETMSGILIDLKIQEVMGQFQ